MFVVQCCRHFTTYNSCKSVKVTDFKFDAHVFRTVRTKTRSKKYDS